MCRRGGRRAEAEREPWIERLRCEVRGRDAESEGFTKSSGYGTSSQTSYSGSWLPGIGKSTCTPEEPSSDRYGSSSSGFRRPMEILYLKGRVSKERGKSRRKEKEKEEEERGKRGVWYYMRVGRREGLKGEEEEEEEERGEREGKKGKPKHTS